MNEELQSANEELETTNEELQSTNEELETMNEELQSTNEELHSINEILLQRSDEVNQLNSFLESILSSLHSAVVVLDVNFYIQNWNTESEEQWGLRSDEVMGQHFMNLDIGLPVEQLRQPIRNCLNQESQVEEVLLSAINRRGRAIDCKITCTPLFGANQEIRGTILIMEQQPCASQSGDGDGQKVLRTQQGSEPLPD
jgi:two-component system CheB/CheR fusion protein